MKIDPNTKILIPEVPGSVTDRVSSGPFETYWRSGCEEFARLKNPVRGLKAELIDGAWYWVAGCQVCVGQPNSWMNYHCCEEHNVCSGCGVHHKQASRAPGIHNAVHGHPDGWRCHDCYVRDRVQTAMAALEKAARSAPDTDCTDEVVCPHCGTGYQPDGNPPEGEETCGTCGGKYDISFDISVTYNTRIVGHRVTADNYQYSEADQ